MKTNQDMTRLFQKNGIQEMKQESVQRFNTDHFPARKEEAKCKMKVNVVP